MNVNRRNRTVLGGAAAGVLGIGLLAGCGTGVDYDPAAAGDLQAAVQTVTQLTADEEYSRAMEVLQRLQTSIEAAASDGMVSDERRQRVESAIDGVRTDLKSKIDEQEQDQDQGGRDSPDAAPKTAVPETAAPGTPGTQTPGPETPGPAVPAPPTNVHPPDPDDVADAEKKRERDRQDDLEERQDRQEEQAEQQAEEDEERADEAEDAAEEQAEQGGNSGQGSGNEGTGNGAGNGAGNTGNDRAGNGSGAEGPAIPAPEETPGDVDSVPPPPDADSGGTDGG